MKFQEPGKVLSSRNEDRADVKNCKEPSYEP